MRHIVDFRTNSDTGEIDADAVIPYLDGEAANQTTFRRPVENTRSRTEVLRTHMREHVLMRDIDRNGPGLWGGGTITFYGTAAGGGDGKFTVGSSLYVVPMITPGDGVGSTPPYIASSKALLTIGTLGSNQVIVTSVKKQFEGSDLAKADANRLSVEVLNDTAESIVLEGASGDVNNIKIKIISGTTTAQDLVDLINNDVTVTQYVTAALEGTSTGTNNADLWGPSQWGSDFSQRFLQGGYPGVVHEIPFGNINSFFAAHAENPLKKGDTLAIAYDKIIDDGGIGGVLQSTTENGNTVMSAGSLINTRREPERCANAIAICKCIDNDTILFIDGSYIKKDVAASLYFDSGSVTNAALLGAIDTTGWTRMHQSPGAHIPPTNIQESLNNADDIFQSVMAEIEAARNSSVYGAQSSLDARMEPADVEINNARNSATYGAKASLDLRIEAPELEIGGARVTDPLQPGGGGYTDLAERLSRHAGHAAATVTVSSVAGDDAMFTTIDAAITALNAADGGTILVRKGTSAYSITGPITVSKPTRIIAVEPGIEIENNIAGVGSYPFYFNTGSDRSYLWGFKITQGSAGNNMGVACVGSTYRVTLERCEIHGTVLLDSLHSHVIDCDIYEPDELTGDTLTWLVAARSDHVSLENCRLFSAASNGMISSGGILLVTGFSPKQIRMCNCEFTVRDTLLAIKFANGQDHSIENIVVNCEPYQDSTLPIIELSAARMDADAIRVYVDASTTNTIRQPLLLFSSIKGFLKDFFVQTGSIFVDTGPSKNPIRITGVDCVVEGLNVEFMIPAATDSAPAPGISSSVDPLVYIRCNTTKRKCTLRNSVIAVKVSGSGTNGYSVLFLGDDTNTSAGGTVLIDNVHFMADPLEQDGTSHEIYALRYLPDDVIVRNCFFQMNCNDGHPIWCEAHLNFSIENNRFDLVPAGASNYPNGIYLNGSVSRKGDRTRIVGNRMYTKPTGGSVGTIYLRGGGTAGSRAYGTLINDNMIYFTATKNVVIIQYELTRSGLWGNQIYDGTTVFTQTDCTIMNPTAATAGTYNTT